jgi:hypothetical protein
MRLLLCLLTTVLAVPLPVAGAHGPCGKECLSETSGPPSTDVETRHLKGVLAVWNPRPNTLGLGVPGTSAACDVGCARRKSIFHLDVPSLILDEATRPAVMRFKVPDVPPGRYLVVVYDGSENGFHYTWQPFTVTSGESDEPAEGRFRLAAWLPAVTALLGFVIGAVVCVARGFLSKRARAGPARESRGP